MLKFSKRISPSEFLILVAQDTKMMSSKRQNKRGNVFIKGIPKWKYKLGSYERASKMLKPSF